MRRKDRILKVLRDAERDFRLSPSRRIHNSSGLCLYVTQHPLIKMLSFKTEMFYKREIFGEMYTDKYQFTDNFNQEIAWKNKIPGYNFERADWCKEQIKLRSEHETQR